MFCPFNSLLFCCYKHSIIHLLTSTTTATTMTIGDGTTAPIGFVYSIIIRVIDDWQCLHHRLTHKSIFAVLKLSKQTNSVWNSPPQKKKNRTATYQQMKMNPEWCAWWVVLKQQQKLHIKRIGFAKQKENNYRCYLSRFVTSI